MPKIIEKSPIENRPADREKAFAELLRIESHVLANKQAEERAFLAWQRATPEEHQALKEKQMAELKGLQKSQIQTLEHKHAGEISISASINATPEQRESLINQHKNEFNGLLAVHDQQIKELDLKHLMRDQGESHPGSGEDKEMPLKQVRRDQDESHSKNNQQELGR